jgi:hypothetical protein
MTEQSRGPNLHHQLFTAVLEKVAQDRYPSNQQLDLLEENLTGRERAELAEALLDKIRQDRYPSMGMVRRVMRLAG